MEKSFLTALALVAVFTETSLFAQEVADQPQIAPPGTYQRAARDAREREAMEARRRADKIAKNRADSGRRKREAVPYTPGTPDRS